MKLFLCNIRRRRTSTIFLMLGICIGISILCFDISYSDSIQSKEKKIGIKEKDYMNFFIGSANPINEFAENIDSITKTSFVNLILNLGEFDRKVTLTGVAYPNNFESMNLISDLIFSENEINSKEKLAVVGTHLKDKMYKKNGENYIEIMNQEFRVTKIDKQPKNINSIFVSIKSFLELVGNKESYNIQFFILNQNINEENISNTLTYRTDNNTKIINIKSKSYRTSNSILTLISLIAMTISMINIINFTKYWIGKRRKEIALRKTVGATNKDIWILIFSELTLISLGSLVISLIIQQVIYTIINKFTTWDVFLFISVKNVLLCTASVLLISAVTSIPSFMESTKIYPAIILKEE